MYRIFSGYRGIRKLKNIKYIPCGIKYYFQRAKRGWADCDTWNMDQWFLEVIPDMLRYFKDNHMGCPIFDLKLSDEENNAQWEQIISRMIWLSNEMNELKCSQQNEYIFDFSEEGKTNFIKRQQEIDDYMDGCKKEFFELFSKYFYNLWN